ncbi:hypothetical protein, partial [Nonomuraea longicatena]|uniref:hypothetical protein n=1 Tax=Nonomuraea longicatena TaxID=83682 RepID=UPI0031D81105
MLVGTGDPRLADAGVSGHKFARQEALRQAGFRVPEFFCVPAEVFDTVARDLVPPPPDPGDEAALTALAAEAAGRLAAEVPQEG